VIHLLVNATVLTMDDSLPVAQALAVNGDGLHEGMTFSLNSYPMTFSCSTGTFLVRP
jgi:hypothetical protein